VQIICVNPFTLHNKHVFQIFEKNSTEQSKANSQPLKILTFATNLQHCKNVKNFGKIFLAATVNFQHLYIDFFPQKQFNLQ
jgi:hypothetical protein